MLWAQMPPATDAQLLSFLLGGAAIMAIVYLGLGIAVAVRKLRAAVPKPPDQDFVTKAEFAAFRDDILEKFEARDTFVRREVDALKKDVMDRVQKMDDYLHDSNHRVADAIQQLLLKVERLIAKDEFRHPEPARRTAAQGEP